MTPPLLVVTDLDGTLLDHHDYSYAPALPVIERLQAHSIPLIANTSKTRAEWLAMRDRFHKNTDPFVTENGSAIFMPEGSQTYGRTREEILDLLQPFRKSYRFEGFADWTTAQVQEHTGLDQEAAALAQEREFSEPLIWHDTNTAKASFLEALADHELMTLQGGRFLHVLGKTDKGRPLSLLRDYYRENEMDPIVIALGDSPNDIAMLEYADIGVIIASPKVEELEVPHGKRIERSTLQGPAGWAEVLTKLIDEYLSN